MRRRLAGEEAILELGPPAPTQQCPGPSLQPDGPALGSPPLPPHVLRGTEANGLEGAGTVPPPLAFLTTGDPGLQDDALSGW